MAATEAGTMAVKAEGRSAQVAAGENEPKVSPGRSERSLLRAARRGDKAAIEALVNRHWDRAHRIAYGILGDIHAAEDVAQEAMLSALSRLGRFDVFRPFEPWLHRIVTNRALDWQRAKQRRGELVGYDLATQIDARATPAADPELEDALTKLTAEQRAIVTLRYIGGYSPAEIAKALDIPRGTVGSRLRRALDKLRDAMEANDA